MDRETLRELGQKVTDICERIIIPIKYILSTTSVMDLTEIDLKRLQYVVDIDKNLTDCGENIVWFMKIEKNAP